jgi:hypothetical protein
MSPRTETRIDTLLDTLGQLALLIETQADWAKSAARYDGAALTPLQRIKLLTALNRIEGAHDALDGLSAATIPGSDLTRFERDQIDRAEADYEDRLNLVREVM